VSRLVQAFDMPPHFMPPHFPGTIVRLNDAKAAEAIRRGKGKGITPVRYLVSIPPINKGEVAGLPDAQAAAAIALELVEPLPPEPDSEEAAEPQAESKGLERPPVDRMIHRAPVAKEVKP
jgi:hypothetical protein